MIYSQYGCRVQIIACNEKRGTVRIKYSDGIDRLVPISSLKADNGFKEIYQEVQKLKGENR